MGGLKQEELGRQGEDIAWQYLRKKRWRLVERNWRCKWGEIDLIVRKKKTLVIVEVKLRSLSDYGLADEMVTKQKQRKIIMATKVYTQKEDWRGDVRFDVVAIENRGNGYRVEHIENAFQV